MYCSRIPNILRFEISDEGWFLVFGVSNAKFGNLAFDTLDVNALRLLLTAKYFFHASVDIIYVPKKRYDNWWYCAG